MELKKYLSDPFVKEGILFTLILTLVSWIFDFIFGLSLDGGVKGFPINYYWWGCGYGCSSHNEPILLILNVALQIGLGFGISYIKNKATKDTGGFFARMLRYAMFFFVIEIATTAVLIVHRFYLTTYDYLKIHFEDAIGWPFRIIYAGRLIPVSLELDIGIPIILGFLFALITSLNKILVKK